MTTMITPEQIVDAIDESMFDCYPQWRELTPSDLPIVAERIANALANTEPEDEHVFCPTCKAEVYWVKGWYDCDSCGQLKEHPLMDTSHTEPADEFDGICSRCGYDERLQQEDK